MKKLTKERRTIVEKAIDQGKASYRAYREANESTFTETGRKLIKPYWDAQESIMDALGCSTPRAVSLIEGKKTLEDYYDQDGQPKQVKK